MPSWTATHMAAAARTTSLSKRGTSMSLTRLDYTSDVYKDLSTIIASKCDALCLREPSPEASKMVIEIC